jgi:hypothetical protein
MKHPTPVDKWPFRPSGRGAAILVVCLITGFAIWRRCAPPSVDNAKRSVTELESRSAATLDPQSDPSEESEKPTPSRADAVLEKLSPEAWQKEIARTDNVFRKVDVFKRTLRDREVPRYRVIYEGTTSNGDPVRVGVLERPSPSEVEAAHVEAGLLLDQFDPESRKLARWLLEKVLEDHLSFSGRFRFLASRKWSGGYVNVGTGFTDNPSDALPDETGSIESIRGTVYKFTYPGDERSHPPQRTRRNEMAAATLGLVETTRVLGAAVFRHRRSQLVGDAKASGSAD